MKTHVLIVSNTLAEGGAERWASVTASTLDRARFQVSVALFRDRVDYSIPDDVAVTCLGHRSAWHSWRTVRRLTKLMRDARVDVVISNGTYTGPYAAQAAAAAGVRWIARIDNNVFRPGRRFVERLNWRWLASRLSHAHAIVGNCDAMSSSLRSALPVACERVTTIRNAVSDVHCEFQRERLSAQGEMLIVAAGRLHPLKRPDLFIDSIRLLRDSVDFRAIWYGDGPLRDAVVRAIRDARLDDRVELAGFDANLHCRLATAGCFVLCSDYEGSPNVVGEALTLGVPVVSTDCPFGPAELLADERGLLVPTSNAVALAEGIRLTLSDRQAAAERAERGQQWAREHLSTKVIVPRWESLIDQVVGMRRRDQLIPGGTV